jgi:hypothetical protein
MLVAVRQLDLPGVQFARLGPAVRSPVVQAVDHKGEFARRVRGLLKFGVRRRFRFQFVFEAVCPLQCLGAQVARYPGRAGLQFVGADFRFFLPFGDFTGAFCDLARAFVYSGDPLHRAAAAFDRLA